MSVDQVGSKDSDLEVDGNITASSMCPLIRLVPRTATFYAATTAHSVQVSVDQVGSKDSDSDGDAPAVYYLVVSVDQVGSKDSDTYQERKKQQ